MFDDLSEINATIIASVEGAPDCPVLIYYGVGTAAGLRNAEGILELENYHQFPPFLQDLKNQIPTLKIHLVLMDPQQERPIYMKEPMNLTEITEDLYADERVTVYVLRKDVLCTDEPGVLNIKHDLACMNCYAMENNLSIIYHNFTGRSNETIAELFDQDLNEHLDHIVYGLGNRQDLGCYFNLNEMRLPYRLISPAGRRPMVTFFNIYEFIITKDYTRLLQAAKQYDKALIQTQMAQIKDHILTEFRNHLFHNMRMVKTNEVSCYTIKVLPQSVQEALQDENQNEAFNLLKVQYGEKLDILCQLKGLSCSGVELMNRITKMEPNGYHWYTHLLEVFS